MARLRAPARRNRRRRGHARRPPGAVAAALRPARALRRSRAAARRRATLGLAGDARRCPGRLPPRRAATPACGSALSPRRSTIIPCRGLSSSCSERLDRQRFHLHAYALGARTGGRVARAHRARGRRVCRARASGDGGNRRAHTRRRHRHPVRPHRPHGGRAAGRLRRTARAGAGQLPGLRRHAWRALLGFRDHGSVYDAGGGAGALQRALLSRRRLLPAQRFAANARRPAAAALRLRPAGFGLRVHGTGGRVQDSAAALRPLDAAAAQRSRGRAVAARGRRGDREKPARRSRPARRRAAAAGVRAHRTGAAFISPAMRSPICFSTPLRSARTPR